MNSKITLNQKRFLIIWISIHSLALFVNLFQVNGALKNTNYSPIFNVFTTSENIYNKDDFWPFVNYYIYGKCLVVTEDIKNTPLLWKDWAHETNNFFGVFNSYNFPEYIFYILLGLGIIFLPKFWNN